MTRNLVVVGMLIGFIGQFDFPWSLNCSNNYKFQVSSVALIVGSEQRLFRFLNEPGRRMFFAYSGGLLTKTNDAEELLDYKGKVLDFCVQYRQGLRPPIAEILIKHPLPPPVIAAMQVLSYLPFCRVSGLEFCSLSSFLRVPLVEFCS